MRSSEECIWNKIRNRIQPQPTPKAGVIRWKAHAATLTCAALIVPSLCGGYFYHAGLKENEPYWVWASTVVWKALIVCAAVMVFFWLFEKPKLTKYTSLTTVIR